MTKKLKILTALSITLLLLFFFFVFILKFVDVAPIGPEESNVGLSSLNAAFAKLFPYNSSFFTLTDWTIALGILVAAIFGILGLYQLLSRKSFSKVDSDIFVLGGTYIIIIVSYVIFDMFSLNSRPVIIDSVLEPSFPSTHTMVILSVFATAIHQINFRVTKKMIRYALTAFCVLFMIFSVISRLITGVHWFTDIIGAIILSAFFFITYFTICEYIKNTKTKKAQKNE